MTIVAVSGDLDLEGTRPFMSALTGAVAERAAGEAVVVNLCACDFMDSSGIAALLKGYQDADKSDVRYVIACSPAGAPARVLELTIAGLLTIQDDLSSALRVVGADDKPTLRVIAGG